MYGQPIVVRGGVMKPIQPLQNNTWWVWILRPITSPRRDSEREDPNGSWSSRCCHGKRAVATVLATEVLVKFPFWTPEGTGDAVCRHREFPVKELGKCEKGMREKQSISQVWDRFELPLHLASGEPFIPRLNFRLHRSRNRAELPWNGMVIGQSDDFASCLLAGCGLPPGCAHQQTSIYQGSKRSWNLRVLSSLGCWSTKAEIVRIGEKYLHQARLVEPNWWPKSQDLQLRCSCHPFLEKCPCSRLASPQAWWILRGNEGLPRVSLSMPVLFR